MIALPTTPLAFRTHCPYCAFQCGTMHVDDGIQGDPHFPVNNGQLCIKGWTAGALLRHPDRLTTPLIRRNGKLVAASWIESLDLAATMIAETKASHGVDAVGVFGSGALTNEKTYLLGKFARLAVGTANIDYNGRYCMSSAAAGGNRAFGIDRGLPFPVADIAEAEVIFLVGANPAETLPPIVQWFEKQKDAGGKMIVSDPRRTVTAKMADVYLPTTTGSDLALANGLLHIAVEERLIDLDYIRERTVGFDAVREVAALYHPAHVERLTGVSEASMRHVVRLLAGARSAMILSGRGPEQQSKGVDTVHAYINLALALGLPGKPASGWGCLTGQGNGQGGREHGQKADQLPGYRKIDNPADRAALAKFWHVPSESLPKSGKSAFELLDHLGPTGIRTLLVMGSNVAVASPNSERVRGKLQVLDHLIVFDSFLNETATQAHIVFPVLQWAEEEGTMTNLEGRVIRRRLTARPPTGVRGDVDVLCELAARLGHAEGFAFPSMEALFNEFRAATSGGIADYAGITYDRIDREAGVFWPCPSEDHPGTPRLFAERFHHPDGKAKFFAVEHRQAGDEPNSTYPYYFTTGRLKEHYNSGAQTRRVAVLVREKPYPRLQIHPTLARRHAVASESLVTLESRVGRAVFLAEVTAEIRPDTMFAPFHWGGRDAANRLISATLDPISRMPEFKLAAVRIVGVQS